MPRKSVPVLDRLQTKLRCKDPSLCWDYMGARVTGYGYITIRRGEQALTHVLMYEATNGAKPKGFDVHHKCGNRACCNPAHLELVEHAEHAREHWKQVKRAPYCGYGHAMTPDNLYQYGNGRICRRCAIGRAAARKKRLRAK